MRALPAAHINAYLMDAPDVWIESRAKPVCNVPAMFLGNKPSDGGNLILSPEERDAVLAREPALSRFVREYIGATEYINGTKRYCLWLKDASPADLRRSPELMRRIAAVREMRLASTAKPTREKAATPHLFFFVSQPETNYILIPSTSSENREYVPIGFLPPSVIASNAATIVPSASLYHFGVLTSSVHMAWVRAVAGRLESRIRYTPAVYNNFPWSEDGGRGATALPRDETSAVSAPSAGENNLCASASLREKITQTAQAILDARARYPDASLADLYDPLTMPADMRAAHAANDRAVLAAYGWADATKRVPPGGRGATALPANDHAVEEKIVARLFRLYAAM